MSAWNCFRVRAESCWPERRTGDELFNHICVFFHLLLGGAAGGSGSPKGDQFLYRRLGGALQSLSPVRKGVRRGRRAGTAFALDRFGTTSRTRALLWPNL